MSDAAIEFLQIRAWVYERLRQARFGQQSDTLSDVASHVRSRAVEAGLLQRPTGATDDIPKSISNPVREVIWQLIIQGIIVPGIGIGSSTGAVGLPHFQITDWGKHCFEAGEFLPYDAGQFIERLKATISSIDRVVVFYLTEALQCFRGGTYLGSAVMVGVASEQVLLQLRGAIEAALDTPEKKHRFVTSTQAKLIKRVSEEIWKRLDPVMEQICAALNKADINVELLGVFGLIRKTRNDAGHPTGRNVDREEAFALLQLFPTYCKTVYDVIEWLKTNKL